RRTATNHGAVAPGDEGPPDAAFHQQLQAMAVEYVETLQLFTLWAVPETAVSQHTVDIESHEAQGADAFDHDRIHLGENHGFGRMRDTVRGHVQITFAAMRSCICRAPNNSPVSSTTSI